MPRPAQDQKSKSTVFSKGRTETFYSFMAEVKSVILDVL